MNDKPHKKSIHEAVLERIRGGEVTMRPRWHFMLKATLVVAGIALAGLTLLFVVSLAMFALRASGVWFMPAFGWHGFAVFLWSLPKLLILLAIVFIIILELLVRHYAFAYRRPLLISALMVIALALLGGFLVIKTTFHSRLLERAERDRLPFAGSFYREYGAPRFRNVHIGEVTEVTEQGFMIKTRRDEVLRIVVTPETRFPLGLDIQQGDRVVVFGDRDDDAVQALGIQRIDSKENPWRVRGNHRPAPPPFFHRYDGGMK